MHLRLKSAHRVPDGFDDRRLIIIRRFVFTIESARHKATQHLFLVAVTPKGKAVHQAHIRIAVIVLQILSVVERP